MMATIKPFTREEPRNAMTGTGRCRVVVAEFSGLAPRSGATGCRRIAQDAVHSDRRVVPERGRGRILMRDAGGVIRLRNDDTNREAV